MIKSILILCTIFKCLVCATIADDFRKELINKTLKIQK